MESQGSQLKHEREKQIYEKRAELDKLNQEKHAKQAIKDEAETHEKAALDVIREEEDRQRALKVWFEIENKRLGFPFLTIFLKILYSGGTRKERKRSRSHRIFQ